MPYIAPEVVQEAKRMDLLTYLKNYEPFELPAMGNIKMTEMYMRRTAEGGQAHFRIWIISAVPLMDVQEARIFTGGIIRSCWRTMDCPI